MKKLFTIFATFAMLCAVGCEVQNNDSVNPNEKPDTSVEGNKIYYTTSDGKKLFPNNTEPAAFGAILVSNTYEEGQGVLTFDDTITSIGFEAFRDCTSLTSVTIPDGVTSIGEDAFRDCSSLTSITIPDGVTKIGNYAFKGCTGELIINSKIVETDYSSDTYPSYNGWLKGAKFSKLTIGNGVTKIGDNAFYNCTSLTSVTIPDGVTSIGSWAFAGCTGELIINSKIVETDYSYAERPSNYGWLKGSKFSKLTIGNGVTEIGKYAFDDCSSLTNITIPDSVTSIGEHAFDGCYSLTSVTIGNGVTSIGDDAFYKCSSLTSVTIPDSVTEIGVYAFSGCSSLTSITIPNSVTSIGSSAFSGCKSLTSFYGKFASEDGKCLIVDNVLKAFAIGCNLAEYTIPNSVTSIGEYAFYDCSSLTEVYCKPTSPPSGDSSMFYDNASGRKIYVPTESVEAYKAAEYWSDYAADIVGYDF